jgi:TM2 domain-containing membrane protein YozV
MSKKRTTAAALAFCGGALGLHKFYLGETGTGIFYIILSWMLLGMFRIPFTVFIGIIDSLRILSMSDEKFDDKYNKRLRRARHRATAKSETLRKNTKSYQYNERKKRVRKNPFKISGKKKYEDYDLEEAIKDYEQALTISPDDADIHFDMAAIYSLLEKKDKSFFHIQRAQESGFKKTDKILEMDDFAFLRIQKEFDEFKENGFRFEKAKQIESPKEDLLQDDLLLSQLNKLKTLRERGLLSEKEFLYEKEKLLKR